MYAPVSPRLGGLPDVPGSTPGTATNKWGGEYDARNGKSA